MFSAGHADFIVSLFLTSSLWFVWFFYVFISTRHWEMLQYHVFVIPPTFPLPLHLS